MVGKLNELVANIQGLTYALTLLDGYPDADRKLAPAIHAIHGELEDKVISLGEVTEQIERIFK